MQIKTKNNYKLKCNCGTELGRQEGSWWVYENPLMCGECGIINTGRLYRTMTEIIKEKA